MNTVLIFDDARAQTWSKLLGAAHQPIKMLQAQDLREVVDSLLNVDVDILVINTDMVPVNQDILIQLLEEAANGQCSSVLLIGKNSPEISLSAASKNMALDYLPHSTCISLLAKRVLTALEICNLQREVKQVSKQLSEASNRTHNFLNNTREGVLEYNHQGIITFANARAENTLGYSQNELVNRKIIDLIDNDDLDHAAFTELKSKMMGEKAFNGRSSIRTSREKSKLVEFNCSMLRHGDGLNSMPEPQHILMFQDITARVVNEERLIKMAKYDLLTGLSNRSKFHDIAEDKLRQCDTDQQKLALLFLDLDNFKNINDVMGHDAGDTLLIAIAERLKNCIRDENLVARIGGDEFSIILMNVDDPNQVARHARNILGLISKPYIIEGREVNITVSVGISLYPDSGNDVKDLTQAADSSMYQAKRDGRNTFRFFSNEIQNRAMAQSQLEDAIRKAISNDDFYLHYQPQIDVATGKIRGLEALIRWQHKDWPNIGPAQFIPLAEECGLLPAIGEWVLYTACRQTKQWIDSLDVQMDFPVSVNLSPKQLINDDFPFILDKILRDTGLPPENLVLELTETAVMQDPDVAISTLNRIKQAGVQISVDDFGTGYSSLNYLRKLPIAKLKIDRSFINDIGIDSNGEAIIKTILTLAHSLNLQVVAEGVEEKFQLDFLREHNCDQVQGFYFSRPLAVESATELLRQEKIDWDMVSENGNNRNLIRPPGIKPPLH